jgi:acyl carrier protein
MPDTSPGLLPKLLPIFREVFERDDLVISRASDAASVVGWDSLIQLHLITAIEQEFRVKFMLSELQSLRNVGEMIDLLERKGVR